MADLNNGEDGWVFDSLVNFLHGPVWKLPVMGFIEEKSVVFDPDSYNNMTDEKEDEYRSIHEEYKALVDYMLTNFMEDIQVSPEQVEDACRIREQRNKVHNLPESHITKIALEQLWAAEDFGAFRRLMTRKNIDLQLQSLELLVAKYGVLSPSLRPNAEDEDLNDPNCEEDFLQVVIRYTEPDAVFQSSLVTMPKNRSSLRDAPSSSRSALADQQSSSKKLREMRKSKSEGAKKSLLRNTPSPVNHTLPEQTNSVAQEKSRPEDCTSPDLMNVSKKGSEPPKGSSPLPDVSQPLCLSPVVTVVSVHEESRSPPLLEQERQIMQQEEEELQGFKPIPATATAHLRNPDGPQSNEPVPDRSRPEIQETLEQSSNSSLSTITEAGANPNADLVNSAPEQHRILSAVRRALDVPSETPSTEMDSSTLELLNMNKGTPEQVERRREYLKSQRDKLIAIKKRERQKQFHSIDIQPGMEKGDALKNAPLRPKSAKAAQMAVNSPESVLVSGATEKSLQARRALAQRLKQELLAEK